MSTFRQLDLFGSIAPIELPTLGTFATFRRGGIIVLASGPIPLHAGRCDCGEVLCVLTPSGPYSVELRRTVPVWGCLDCNNWCDRGEHLTRTDYTGICSNCDACHECCECFYCEGCEESVSSVGSCYRCDRCCDCFVCARCDLHGEYGCSDCDRCQDCCDCTRCDYCCEVSDEVCDAHGYCSGCCDSDECGGEDVTAADFSSVPRYVAGSLSVIGPYSFGVELEHTGTSNRGSLNALDRAGIGPSWEAHAEHCGTEVVSPVLRGDDGFAQMTTAMLALSAIGGRVNGSCGTHVHIGADDMEPADIVRLVRFYNRHAAVIDTIHVPSRRGVHHTYCGPHPAAEIVAMETELSNGGDFYGLSRCQHSRYQSVNLHALRKHGTVEFRQHGGTLDPEKLGAWVRFLFALCNASRFSSASETFDSLSELLAYLSGYGLDQASVTYLLDRAATLA